MMNFEYIQRPERPEIITYINKNIDMLKTLEYEINYALNQDELRKLLNEDLPGPSSSEKTFLIEDITSVVTGFFERSESKQIDIKVQIITSDMCRLFHEDNIWERLLCTYSGPGTEWLNNDNVNRDWLGKGDNSKIVKNFSKVNKASVFDLLFLRGRKFQPNFQGVVHRSPPIQESGEKRVLLKIDER